MTKRQLFSICGKLTGHFPVCGWLRVACSYVKRFSEGKNWEDYAGKKSLLMMKNIIERVNKDDPVRGKWLVPA